MHARCWVSGDAVPPGSWARHDQYPEPLTPLFAGLAIASDIPRGLAAGRDEFAWPLPPPELIVVDGYLYAGQSPAPPLPSADRLARFEAKIRAGHERSLVADWHARRRPALQRAERDLLARDLPALSNAALLDRVGACSRHVSEVFAAMLTTAFANALAIGRLEAFCGSRGTFAEPDLLRLLAGTAMRVSREPVAWLARLARLVEANAALRVALDAPDPWAVPSVRALLRPWLDAYGHHALALEYAAPTLAERPERIIPLLRDAVARLPAGHERARDGAMDRDRVWVDTFRSRLRSAADREAYDRLLGEFQAAYAAREGARVLGDGAIGVQHQTLLEAGHRLRKDGPLTDADGVFLLWPEELEAALSGQCPSGVPATVTARRAEHERHKATTPPPSFGTPQSEPSLPLSGDGREALAAVARYYRRVFTPLDRPAAVPGTTLLGGAGSPGTYRGPARVVLDEEHLDRVEPGVVMVCRITSPIWGALFGGIGALVTEQGGMLSHAATTAREFGIPAVVGVAGATGLIRDGQIVEVDGTAGTIRIEPRAVR